MRAGLIVLMLVGVVRGEETPARKRALLVGVSTYRKVGFADRPLAYAAADMEALAGELRGEGWEVTPLFSRGATDQATRAGFLAGLDRVLQGVNADDLVLIAFSGHGLQFRAAVATDEGPREQEEAFLCPSDAVAGEPATLVGMSELLATLGRRGGRNLVLIDACRDDPAKGGRGVDGNTARLVPANTSVLFSCAARQQSFETNRMFGERSARGHGVFLHRVLKGLRGEAVNDRGEVTWLRLVEYACEHVNGDALKWFPERAIEGPGGRKLLQTPHVISSLVGPAPVLAGTDAAGKYRLGAQLMLNQGNRDQTRRALGCLRTAADEGSAAAMGWLALLQDHGFDFTPIDKASVRLRLRLSAAGGYAPARALLGMDLLTGDVDLPRDEPTGQRLLAAAAPELPRLAAAGDALAQFCLAAMHEDGLGAAKNEPEALRRYRLAADQGLAVAQNNLGLMHEQGRGTPRDPAEARRWYQRAADQGSAAAQFNLALLLQRQGRPTNEVIAWLRRAAVQGHAESRAELKRRKLEP